MFERSMWYGTHGFRRAVIVGFLLTFLRVASAIPVRNLAIPAPTTERARISGRVVWEGHRLDSTMLYLYTDATLRELYGGSPLLSDSGTFQIDVPPGSYYIVAVVDRNRTGTFDAGDALGISGIVRWDNPHESKRPVTVKNGQQASDVTITISAIRVQEGDQSRIVALSDADPAVLADPGPDSRRTARILGRVLLPTGEPPTERPVYVFAYTDVSWRRRLAQATVGEGGSFTLSVPPGTYYVTAVMDMNGSNLFDEGDAFGLYGLTATTEGEETSRGPRPVLLGDGEERSDLVIPLVARQTEGGKLAPLDEKALAATPSAETTVVVRGRVTWKGQALRAAVVELYDDPALLNPVGQTLARPDGTFEFTTPPGEYFIIANVDRDGDDRLTPGDGVGAYGSTDITRLPPQPFHAAADAEVADVQITGVYSDTGELVPVEKASSSNGAATTQAGATGVMGRLLWDGQAPKEAWLLLSATPDFREPDMRLIELDGFGNFAIGVRPGAYYLMAIVDATGDEKIGIGDGVAVYGTRAPLGGSPSQFRVWQDRITPYIHLWVSAVVTDDSGGYAPLDDGNRFLIRRRYGEPNDRYRRHEDGQLLEEWWYWDQGISFTFASEGPGWQLKDTYRFTPNRETLEKTRPANLSFAPALIPQSTVDAIVYYVADRQIWALAPDGSQAYVVPGESPRATPQGLLYRNEDREPVLFDGNSTARRVGRPGLDVSQLAISDDGSTIAYVRDHQLRLRRMSTGEELVTPVRMARIASPDWHPNGFIVVFAGTGEESDATKPSDGTMNLYAYDAVKNHVEPLVVGPSNDTEPIWSPTGAAEIAFTREVDGISQVYVATFDKDGKSTVRQVTTYGGRHPSWLPDGSGIVYETDGQLWTVSVTKEETGRPRPLIVNGQPILGSEPTAAPAAR